MKILRAYKTELDPTNKQRTMFRRCVGVTRFVYNWGLADHESRYQRGEDTRTFTQCVAFNAIKYEEFPFVAEVPYAVTESSFRNLRAAFSRYFREKKNGVVTQRITAMKRNGKWKTWVARSLKKGRKGYQLDPGYPKFKVRGRNSSFQLRYTKVKSDAVRLTRAGWVRLKERNYIPSNASKYGVYATVSERAGRWFISVLVEKEIEDLVNGSTLIIGIDFGLKTLAVLSNGETFENPHALIIEQCKMARLGRELARREKGSQNWRKTKRKIQRCHARIANVRKHVLHDISHHVTADLRPKTVVIEDLNVSGMAKNRHLSKAIHDAGFAELRRQIEYKARWYGVEVLLADRWFASSKTCSACGCIKDDLTLADRVFKCADCGTVIDRDLNAAINLAALGEPQNMRGLPVELGCNETLL